MYSLVLFWYLSFGAISTHPIKPVLAVLLGTNLEERGWVHVLPAAINEEVTSLLHQDYDPGRSVVERWVGVHQTYTVHQWPQLDRGGKFKVEFSQRVTSKLLKKNSKVPDRPSGLYTFQRLLNESSFMLAWILKQCENKPGNLFSRQGERNSKNTG